MFFPMKPHFRILACFMVLREDSVDVAVSEPFLVCAFAFEAECLAHFFLAFRFLFFAAWSLAIRFACATVTQGCSDNSFFHAGFNHLFLRFFESAKNLCMSPTVQTIPPAASRLP